MSWQTKGNSLQLQATCSGKPIWAAASGRAVYSLAPTGNVVLVSSYRKLKWDEGVSKRAANGKNVSSNVKILFVPKMRHKEQIGEQAYEQL